MVERRDLSQSRGVAMVIVLWVIMVLSLLISGFAFTMQVETQVASFSRKELKAEMLARSGIEVARMQLMLHMTSPTESGFDALNQDWATNETLYVDHELGDGKYNVKITDEESKLPINLLSQDQLRRLMDLLGIDPSDGDVIVDSILDWREPGDLHRLNGAKSDYYESLSPPYSAKNAPLDRVEELLLIRGVTKEIYDGTPATEDEPARPGLKNLFTTTSSGQVNINTASSIVLQTILGLDDTHVAALLTRRDGPDGVPGTEDDQPFGSVGEFGSQVAGPITVNSSYFTVKSTGEVGGAKRTIIAVLYRQGLNVVTVTWNEVRGGL
ncbi:MAG: type II secretion system minor pseudopilin GspK [Verrucomicrobiia bacterium]